MIAVCSGNRGIESTPAERYGPEDCNVDYIDREQLTDSEMIADTLRQLSATALAKYTSSR